MKDINKKTLIEALSSLREYEPPDSVWENIDMEMDGKKALSIPSEMLLSLPEYDPPAFVWDHVESKIGEEAAVEPIPTELLQKLPLYEPPTSVWDNIENRMESGDELISKEMLQSLPQYEPPAGIWDNIKNKIQSRQKGRVVSMKWQRTMAIAASVCLLVAAYFLLDTDFEPDRIAVNYSTETVDNMLLSKDWQEDAGDFELYKELCDAKKYICEHPEFQVLQTEFDELSEAVKELEYAIGNFGTSASLVGQIKEIELERTDIFKKMMVMLI